MSYSKNTSTGIAEVTDQSDYYPFGLKHNNVLPSNSYKDHQYNGKELDLGGMYDYGARFYMPDIGIFGQHDPLSESTMQPYAYGYDNPIMFLDPMGKQGEDWVYNYKTNSVYWNDKATSQLTAGANETYLGTSGNYTAYDGSTTTLNPNGTYYNNSLLGSLGVGNNLDPLIQAGSSGPLLSFASFPIPGTGDNAGVIKRAVPTNSIEYAMRSGSGQLAIAGLEGMKWGVSDIVVSRALGGIANYLAFGKGGARVFWSGGDVAKNAAADYAVANGGRTLEMTWVGRGLEYATEKTSYNTMKPFWDYASYSFGRGTQGTANVFINQARYRSGSIWNNVERPLLQSRAININAHLIK